MPPPPCPCPSMPLCGACVLLLGSARYHAPMLCSCASFCQSQCPLNLDTNWASGFWHLPGPVARDTRWQSIQLHNATLRAMYRVFMRATALAPQVCEQRGAEVEGLVADGGHHRRELLGHCELGALGVALRGARGAAAPGQRAAAPLQGSAQPPFRHVAPSAPIAAVAAITGAAAEAEPPHGRPVDLLPHCVSRVRAVEGPSAERRRSRVFRVIQRYCGQRHRDSGLQPNVGVRQCQVHASSPRTVA